ncbi:MAG: flagellar protein FliT [Gallionella sp.]|nr:flagellar protein FliT [Gallionella sp.]MDD4945704.1 flagellar protein FliT [Gallionella sp.]
MNEQDVLTHYESLSGLTAQMRTAAQSGEWDTLIGLEQQCSRHVEQMRAVTTNISLDESSRQRKIQLIKKILADDAAIRNQTESWMGQLQRIMQSNRQEQRLNRSYGAA